MVDLFGSFRLRDEMDFRREDAAGNALPFAHRPQFRLQAGLKVMPHRSVDIVFRLSSGRLTDANEPHQVFGVRNGKLSISIDQAFLAYRPAFAPGLRVAAGKMPHPFARGAVYDELFYDADNQPTGATIAWRWGTTQQLFVVLGEFLLLELGSAADSHFSVGQLGADLRFWGLGLRAALGGELYFIPSDDSNFTAPNRGNSTADNDGDGNQDELASKFRLLEALIDLTLLRLPTPLTLSAGLSHNFGADNDQATAYYLGLSVAISAWAMRWRIYGQFQRVEQDAVFAWNVQDDFHFATTLRGAVFGVRYWPIDWLEVHLWTLLTQRVALGGGGDDGRWQARLRIDLTATF